MFTGFSQQNGSCCKWIYPAIVDLFGFAHVLYPREYFRGVQRNLLRGRFIVRCGVNDTPPVDPIFARTLVILVFRSGIVDSILSDDPYATKEIMR